MHFGARRVNKLDVNPETSGEFHKAEHVVGNAPYIANRESSLN